MIVIRLTPQDDPPTAKIEVPEEFHGPEGERRALAPGGNPIAASRNAPRLKTGHFLPASSAERRPNR